MKPLIATLICLIAGPIFAWSGLKGAFQGMAANSWPTVQGEVRASKVRELRGRYGRTDYYPSVQYRYQVEGKKYYGSEIDAAGSVSASPEKVVATLLLYQPGTPVTVYYNSKDPDQAMLEVGSTFSNWIKALIGLGLATGGVIGAVIAWKKLQDDNYDHSSSFGG